MAQEDKKETQDNRVIQPGGLHTDSSPVVQPAGTIRYALNAVNETAEGQLGFLSRENSNAPTYTLPSGDFVPVGQVYVGNQEKVLMLASSSGNSAIVLLNKKDNITVLVDDSTQTEKLGFSVQNQIDLTYRLRRGCERTIYWVDPKPRYFVLEKPEEFIDPETGFWDINKFNLFRSSSSIPIFEVIRVLNTGGNLLAGSYNFAIRYLDENFNPTGFIEVSDTVSVYNDSFEKTYKDIGGSSNASSPYFEPKPTDKSIVVSTISLDTSFPFYQIAILEATSGTGQITSVKISSELPTTTKDFFYTGSNFVGEIPETDINSFVDKIEKAKNILQVENRLLFSNVEGKPINLCSLQKYASRIKADCVLKTVLLNTLDNANGKSPEAHIEGLGYMPGEIYSFSIEYLFEDGTLSPAYHIPGKNPNLDKSSTFQVSTVNTTYYPMSLDNVSSSTLYVDNNTCESGDLWGVDSEGEGLVNKLVRHHRFPLRGEINTPLFTESTLTSVDTDKFALRVKVSGELNLCTEPDCVDPAEFNYNIKYTVNGEEQNNIDVISIDSWDPSAEIGKQTYIGPIVDFPPILDLSTALTEIDDAGNSTALVLSQIATTPYITYKATSSASGLQYIVTEEPFISTETKKRYETKVLGISFSGIDMPSLADTNGVKIVGYYISRQKRTEENKTILDSAVITPTMNNKSFVSHSLLMPEVSSPTDARINKTFFSFINPEFKFNNKLYTSVDQIVQQGTYVKNSSEKSRFIVQNVMDGTSYDSKRHKSSEQDSDGWSLQARTRDNELEFFPENKILYTKSKIKEMFYLDALASKSCEDPNEKTWDVFNISGDNKIGMLSLTEEVSLDSLSSLPYVVFKRNLSNPYSNFRTDPFYRETKKPIYFEPGVSSKVNVFNGDSYVGAMKYVSTVFHENRIRKRRGKSGLLSIIVGIVAIVGGAILSIFTGGLSLGLVALGAALIGGGGLLAASGMRQENWKNVYNKLYEEGLRETVEDDFIKDWFKNINPSDDEIRWFAEGLTNLWFESSVNINLRQGANLASAVDYINAPTETQTGNGYNGGQQAITVFDEYIKNKLTVANIERAKNNLEGREYIGFPLPELYDLNPDYLRRLAQKPNQSLGPEYDCCSDCFEKFPGRVMYSEQAFQEELSDNFRSFLPNNYIDIEGETGPIVDMFRIQSNLYLHTEDALWHLPQNYQERVVGNLLTVVGTGDYFNTPPRKIVDADFSSAGTSHKWGRTKTKMGVLFPCHREKKIYLFNGQELEPISSKGLFSDFRSLMNFDLEETYFATNNKTYPFLDNPSNPVGVGYISVYDTALERLIVTKKENTITNLPEEDYELCSVGSSTVIFNDYQQTIQDKRDEGFQFIGIENCRMKFKKETLEPRTEIRYQEVSQFKDVDYLIFYYGMPPALTDLDTRSKMISPVDTPYYGWSLISAENPYFQWAGDNRGTGVESLLINVKKLKEDFPTTNEYVFSCAAYWHTHSNLDELDLNSGIVTMKAKAYKGGTMYKDDGSDNNPSPTYSFISVGGVQQGSDYSFNPVEIFGPETQISSEAQPMGTFTYNVQTGDLSCNGASGGSLPPDLVVRPVEVTVWVPVTIIEYVNGTSFTPELLSKGATLSYSLKTGKWISYHSYLPSLYIPFEGKFCSWVKGSARLYEHNIPNQYGTFYGKEEDFVVEVVESANPLVTEVTESVLFQTEASYFDETSQDFVDEPEITFSSALLYNSYQISHWLTLLNKKIETKYLQNQLNQENNIAVLSRKERDWTFNGFRDYSSNSKQPLFIKDPTQFGNVTFTDKIINPLAYNRNKHWSELQTFRDKYLILRLKFNGLSQIKLTFNFLFFDKKRSER